MRLEDEDEREVHRGAGAVRTTSKRPVGSRKMVSSGGSDGVQAEPDNEAKFASSGNPVMPRAQAQHSPALGEQLVHACVHPLQVDARSEANVHPRAARDVPRTSVHMEHFEHFSPACAPATPPSPVHESEAPRTQPALVVHSPAS